MHEKKRHIYILSYNAIPICLSLNFKWLFDSVCNSEAEMHITSMKGYDTGLRTLKKGKTFKIQSSSGRTYTINRYPIITKPLQLIELETLDGILL